MLKGLNTSGRYLQVTGGSFNMHISKSYTSNVHSQGDMRYDLDEQCIKVYDGSMWQTLHGGYATVEMTHNAESLLDWARKKRDEELRIQELANKHPTVADALQAVKHAEEQVRIVAALVQE